MSLLHYICTLYRKSARRFNTDSQLNYRFSLLMRLMLRYDSYFLFLFHCNTEKTW